MNSLAVTNTGMSTGRADASTGTLTVGNTAIGLNWCHEYIPYWNRPYTDLACYISYHRSCGCYSRDKGETAFKIIKSMVDSKLVKFKTVDEFISFMGKLMEML